MTVNMIEAISNGNQPPSANFSMLAEKNAMSTMMKNPVESTHSTGL